MAMTRLYRQIKNRMDKAIMEYRMIEKGDRIMVGVSGGPDSLSLMHLMHDHLKYRNSRFSVMVLHIDLGFKISGKPGSAPLESYLKSTGVDYRIFRPLSATWHSHLMLERIPVSSARITDRHQVYKTAMRKNAIKSPMATIRMIL